MAHQQQRVDDPYQLDPSDAQEAESRSEQEGDPVQIPGIAGKNYAIASYLKMIQSPATGNFNGGVQAFSGSASSPGAPPSNRWLSMIPGAANPDAFSAIGHCEFALLFGVIGAFVARRFEGGRAIQSVAGNTL